MSIKQAILYNGLCACLAFFGVLIGKILVVETDFVARVRCRRERCELDSKLLMSVWSIVHLTPTLSAREKPDAGILTWLANNKFLENALVFPAKLIQPAAIY